MATNDALITEAQELATELGIEVTTEGLTNALLVDLVSDLKAKKTDAEKQTSADGAPPEEPPAETPPEEPPAETPPEEPPAETPPEDEPEKSCQATAEAKAAEEAAKLPERDAKGSQYFVEPGKAITTPMGVMSDHEEIPAKVIKLWDEKTIKAHVKSGVLYRGKK